MKILRLPSIIVSAFIATQAAIIAAPLVIPLVNPSFEESLGYTGGNPSSVPGWTASNSDFGGDVGTFGQVEANTNSVLFTSGVTGNNVIHIGGAITQTTAATFVEGVTYVLSVDVGRPLGQSEETSILFGFRNVANTNFRSQGAGSRIVGDAELPATGTMGTFSISYKATAADAGAPIIIGAADYFSDPLYRLDNFKLGIPSIINPSFEEGAGYNGGSPENPAGTIPGWTGVDGGTYGQVETNTDNSIFTAGVSGNNVIYLGGAISQTSFEKFVSGVTYTLSVDAGRPLSSTGSTGFVFGFRNAANSAFRDQAISGSKYVDITELPAIGTMGTFSVSYTATAADDGTPIIIGATDFFGDPRYRLDNFTLADSGSPLTAIQAWRQSFFGTSENTGDAADDQDPDFDGIANLLEYALNGNPTLSNTSILPTSSLVGGALTLTFLRARADLDYVVQGSTTLATWSDLATNPGAVSTTTPVVFTDSVTSDPSRFLRLEVSSQ